MHWLTRNPPRQTFIEAKLGISPNTVVNWSSYCREVLIFWSIKTSQVIGGPNIVVEIGEAKFGKENTTLEGPSKGNECLAELNDRIQRNVF